MDYQRQLQSEQRRVLKEALKINQQMEDVNANLQKLDRVQEANLGIPQVVIDFLKQMATYNIRVTANNVTAFYNMNSQYFKSTLGELTPDKVKLIMYTHRLAEGKQVIGDEKDLKKLLKMVSLNRYKVTVNDLKIQKYRVYLTKFVGEKVNTILTAMGIFNIKNPEAVLKKIAQRQSHSSKEVSYLLGTYTEWELVSISSIFQKFRQDYGSNLDLIIQMDNSEIIEVPRYAIIKHIEEAPFNIYNSKNNKTFYEVESLSQTSGRALIKTKVKPVIKYKGKYETRGLKVAVPTQTEIDLRKYKEGEVKVYVDKGYYSLCNRYVIIGTLRPLKEELNLGGYRLIAKDGTTVYVVARLVPFNRTISGGGIREQRIYYLGFDPREIEGKLEECAANLQRKLGGYVSSKIPATVEFNLFNKKEEIEYDA